MYIMYVCVCVCVYIGEQTLKLDYLATLTIIGGITLTVLGNNSEPREWPLDALLEQYRKPQIILMLLLFAAAILVMLLFLALDRIARVRKSKDTGEVIQKPSQRVGSVYILVGATVATFTVMFAKAFSGLLLALFDPKQENQFTKGPYAALIVLVFLISLPMQLVLINASLSVNDALYHVPTFYVFWNFGSIISGAILYEELSSFDLKMSLMFGAGILILTCGIVLTNVSTAQKEAMARTPPTGLFAPMIGLFHLYTRSLLTRQTPADEPAEQRSVSPAPAFRERIRSSSLFQDFPGSGQAASTANVDVVSGYFSQKSSI
jgi:MFS family permease